jgi:ABC-type bacteriocin/lantibiotic exporter with double-glycine peptidase domain
MDNKLLNILQSKEVPIENQQIIDYLKGDLNNVSQQQFEEQEQDDAMMQDAMEGLNSIQDMARLEMMTREMNQSLQKKLVAQKNKHKETRKWKDQKWLLLAIATVLMIVVICYMVMKVVKG